MKVVPVTLLMESLGTKSTHLRDALRDVGLEPAHTTRGGQVAYFDLDAAVAKKPEILAAIGIRAHKARSAGQRAAVRANATPRPEVATKDDIERVLTEVRALRAMWETPRPPAN